MQYLWLTLPQAWEIARHALADAPNEACGIIGGRDGRATHTIPTPNIAAEPATHYTLDPSALVKALMAFQQDDLDIIGFYHSHPHDEPIPSATDVALATYPDTAYVIVGLKDGEPELAAWTINYGDVQSLPLHIGNDAPDVEPAPLSPPQKLAIVVSAALAFAVLVVISLTLLPPAPEIILSAP